MTCTERGTADNSWLTLPPPCLDLVPRSVRIRPERGWLAGCELQPRPINPAHQGSTYCDIIATNIDLAITAHFRQCVTWTVLYVLNSSPCPLYCIISLCRVNVPCKRCITSCLSQDRG